MRISSDKGISVAELLVSVSLLFVILSMAYMATDAVNRSNKVSDRQAQFAREVSTPLHVMDKVLSQNKALLNGGAYLSDNYTLTTRGPVTPGTTQYRRYVYSAGTDGRLVEQVYSENIGSAASTLIDTNVWSTTNANRLKGPMFTYLGPSGETTIPAGAKSILVRIWTVNEGKYYSGERQIYFRNR